MGEEGPGGVASHANALAVEAQDILIVRGILVHIGNKAARGIAHGDQLVMHGGQGLFREDVCQNMGRLGPGGGLVQLHVPVHEVRFQHTLRLEIAQVRQGRRGGLMTVGQGGLGLSGPV